MGLFSSVMDFTGIGNLDQLTRTGATQAAKDAEAAGEATLAEQQALKTEIGDIYSPYMDAGTTAFNSLNDYYSGDQSAIIEQAESSPFMSSLIEQGESAIARNAQSTGGWRTGTSNENLAQNSQNVLSSLVSEILAGQSSIAQTGMASTDAYTTAMQNIIAGSGATRGEIANIGISQAANNQNMYSGIAQLGTSLLTASDSRLKKNIVKVGEKNGFNWYTWDWNKLANEIDLFGSDEGHIAQEVQISRPDLVFIKNGYLAINYEGF